MPFRVVPTVLVGILALGSAPDVAGDPAVFLHLKSPRLACLPQAEPASCVQIPAGYFLDEPSYLKLDNEVRRLQDAETRLAAENKSLRQKIESWQPGWKTMLVTVAIGVALGAALDHELR